MTTAAVRGDWMQTYTGRAFFPLDPRPDDLDLRDIAHALGMVVRYAGHVTRFYSVAEHCVLMSEAVAPENAAWALLHDAPEAYIGDMVRPLKRQPSMAAYVEADDRIMATICYRFDLDYAMPAEVKLADTRILRDERAELLGPSPQPWSDAEQVESLGVHVQGWAPDVAAASYLARAFQLGLA